MSNKSANVSVRIQPEIKQQAEAVLDKIGIPVSVLIETLYRQIIYTGGVPYPLTAPKINTQDSMTKQEFDDMMEKGYSQAKDGESVDMDEAFSALKKELHNGIQG